MFISSLSPGSGFCLSGIGAKHGNGVGGSVPARGYGETLLSVRRGYAWLVDPGEVYRRSACMLARTECLPRLVAHVAACVCFSGPPNGPAGERGAMMIVIRV